MRKNEINPNAFIEIAYNNIFVSDFLLAYYLHSLKVKRFYYHL